MEIDNDLFDILYKREIPFKFVKFVSTDCKLVGIQQALTRKYVNEVNYLLESSGVNKKIEDQIRDIMLEKLTDGLITYMNDHDVKCFNILKNNEMIIEERLDNLVYYRITLKYDEILNLDNNLL